jgi:hypothetical protein
VEEDMGVNYSYYHCYSIPIEIRAQQLVQAELFIEKGGRKKKKKRLPRT